MLSKMIADGINQTTVASRSVQSDHGLPYVGIPQNAPGFIPPPMANITNPLRFPLGHIPNFSHHRGNSVQIPPPGLAGTDCPAYPVDIGPNVDHSTPPAPPGMSQEWLHNKSPDISDRIICNMPMEQLQELIVQIPFLYDFLHKHQILIFQQEQCNKQLVNRVEVLEQKVTSLEEIISGLRQQAQSDWSSGSNRSLHIRTEFNGPSNSIRGNDHHADNGSKSSYAPLKIKEENLQARFEDKTFPDTCITVADCYRPLHTPENSEERKNKNFAELHVDCFKYMSDNSEQQKDENLHELHVEDCFKYVSEDSEEHKNKNFSELPVGECFSYMSENSEEKKIKNFICTKESSHPVVNKVNSSNQSSMRDLNQNDSESPAQKLEKEAIPDLKTQENYRESGTMSTQEEKPHHLIQDEECQDFNGKKRENYSFHGGFSQGSNREQEYNSFSTNNPKKNKSSCQGNEWSRWSNRGSYRGGNNGYRKRYKSPNHKDRQRSCDNSGRRYSGPENESFNQYNKHDRGNNRQNYIRQRDQHKFRNNQHNRHSIPGEREQQRGSEHDAFGTDAERQWHKGQQNFYDSGGYKEQLSCQPVDHELQGQNVAGFKQEKTYEQSQYKHKPYQKSNKRQEDPPKQMNKYDKVVDQEKKGKKYNGNILQGSAIETDHQDKQNQPTSNMCYDYTKESSETNHTWWEDVPNPSHCNQHENATDTLLKFIEKEGDLFSVADNCSLVHCVSEDFNMGKGIALEFRNRFGGIGELLDQNQKTCGLAFLKQKARYIYYLVTKERYWHKPVYKSLYNSLLGLRKHCLLNAVNTLAMPEIGCGLDMLKWDIVKDQIWKVFGGEAMTIIVYHLEGSVNSQGDVDLKEEQCKAVSDLQSSHHNEIHIEKYCWTVYKDIIEIDAEDNTAPLAVFGCLDFHQQSGVSATLIKKYRMVDKLLCENKAVGKIVILPERERFLYYMVIKEQPVDVSKFQNMLMNLQAVCEHCVQNNMFYVVIQCIYPVTDELVVEKLKSLIHFVFFKRDIEITFCVPKNSTRFGHHK